MAKGMNTCEIKVLNANEFFNKVEELQAGTANEPVPFVQNQFGAAIGGAIIKNKTFVFGSYEGFRLRQGSCDLSTRCSQEVNCPFEQDRRS